MVEKKLSIVSCYYGLVIKEYNLIKFKNLNIFEPNTLNSDYLIKKYKMTNFSDIKVKKMKSN